MHGVDGLNTSLKNVFLQKNLEMLDLQSVHNVMLFKDTLQIFQKQLVSSSIRF